MTSKEIIDLKKNIVRSLTKRDLNDAFSLLMKLTAYTQDWKLSEQVNELETNYKYMLHYLFEGVEDPAREKVYYALLRSLYEITDDAADEILKIESSNIYFDKLRSYKLKINNSLIYYLDQIKDVLMSISVIGLLEDSNQKRTLAVKRERLSDDLFNAVFVSDRADTKSIIDYYKFIDCVEIAEREKSVFLSALTLNLFHSFDSLKVQVLMHACQSDSSAVRARAMVGLVIVMQMYDPRWKLYPELQQQLDTLSEDPKFRSAVLRTIIQLIRSRETEKISKKLTEEIIPEMMRFNRKTGIKLDMEDIMNESDFADKNPEWQKEIEESGLNKKLQEYSNLQMEGADVFHSTFAGLKSYPFFADISNWFLPFDTSYSEFSDLFQNESRNNILHAAITESGHMCNSDKYSFCLSLMQISSVQRDMMMTRLNAESEQIKQLQQELKGVNPQIEEEIISNQYVQDLYRFFKLNPYRSNFFDIFQLSINFYDKQSIAPLISDTESMEKVALYCFDKNYFAEALSIFTRLVDINNAETNVWQKIAYCRQMLNDNKGALDAYLKADLITPGNSWIIRHIAQLYRNINELDKAIEFYKKTLTITPDNLNIELQIGHCYLEKKEYDNALNSYFKVEMLDAKGSKAFRPIAWTSFLADKLDQSKRYYERILTSKPTINDYLNAGHVALCSANWKKALEFYRHAIELDSMAHFVELLYLDNAVLKSKGVDLSILPMLVDQLKYSVS